MADITVGSKQLGPSRGSRVYMHTVSVRGLHVARLLDLGLDEEDVLLDCLSAAERGQWCKDVNEQLLLRGEETGSGVSEM